LRTEHPKVLRARNGILPEGVMKRIEALVAAAESEHPDDELKQLLRSLVPDFHPHPTTVTPSADDGREISVKDTPAKEVAAIRAFQA